MLAIVSLERSNSMSENTQDDFEPASSPTSGEEMSPDASIDFTPPAEQSASEGETSPASPENSLPPEAQGEANGGPLGCCLGVMFGLVLSLSLAIVSRIYVNPLGTLFQGNYWLLGLLVRILMGILAFAFAMLFGYFGWKLGKRFFREYEPPVVKERKRRPHPKKVHQKA